MGTEITKTGDVDLSKITFGEDAGTGFENDTAADISMPFISMLQPMSPICVDEKAKAGNFYNSVTEEEYDGAEGFYFVPALKQRRFVEWEPRDKGGRFVQAYLASEQVVVDALANGEFGKYKTEEGNDLIDTFYIYGVICEGEHPVSFALMSFTKTKIKPYKKWNTRIRQFTLPSGEKLPLMANLTHVTSEKKKNDKGVYYIPILQPAGGRVASSIILPNDPRYQMAKECRRLVEEGRAKIDPNHERAGADDGNGDENAPF